MAADNRTKRLRTLIRRQARWTPQDLTTYETIKSFSASLPPSNSSAWRSAWQEAGPDGKTNIAKLWLCQFLGEVHDYRPTPSISGHAVSTRWAVQWRWLREVYPHWTDEVLESISMVWHDKTLLQWWLRPTAETPIWQQFHQLWFGTEAEQIRSGTYFSTLPAALSAVSTQLILPTATALLRYVRQQPGATVDIQTACAIHLFLCGTHGDAKPVNATAIEDCWWTLGRYHSRRVYDDEAPEKTRSMLTLLLNEPVTVRLAVLRHLAVAAVTTGDTTVEPGGILDRWVKNAHPKERVASLYAAATCLVPERAQQWHLAQTLELPLAECIAQLDNPVPTATSLPADLTPFSP